LARLRADGLNVALDLAGEGDAGYVARLRQQAKSLGLEDSITWHGYVDAAYKERLYAAADCFALLSHHENFGLAAAEAMAAGVPVVVSDQVGLAPDVLAFQAGCVVPVGDDMATAKAVRIFLESEARSAASIRARQLVKHRYGEREFADGLASVYRHAMS
jgi:glycosyltransferase involved in cell wall biosynthesis